jgi:hypothetical protein
MGFCGHGADGFGNVRVALQAQHADGKVAQAGHQARSRAGAHLRAVFVKGEIAHIVAFVFDAPVTARHRQQPLGRLCLWASW